MASATAATTTGARNRAASPGAKKVVAAAPKAPVVETKPAEHTEHAADAEVGVFGFHPEVERAVIWAPLIIFGTLLLAVGPFRETFTSFGVHCLSTWVYFSGPFEKLIMEHTSMIVALAALSSLAPLIISLIVTVMRTASEVEQNASQMQYAFLVVLLVAALASFIYTGQMSAALEQWIIATKPLEKVLVDNTDNIIAGTAALALAPVGLSIVVFFLKCMCGRTVSVSFEHEDAAETNGQAPAAEKDAASEEEAHE